MFSGKSEIPVSLTDRELISTTLQAVEHDIPYLKHSLSGKPVCLYKVAFDGTMNDKTRVPEGEFPTLVAHIGTLIDAKYYPGPAMQDSAGIDWFDAAMGYSSRRIAEEAERDFFAALIKIRTESPDCELRVFVTGFSRGAAIARHFMNIVDRDWTDQNTRLGNPPRLFALLFDTVATGQLRNLELQLPVSVEYLIHIVANDEPRGLFVPVIDAVDATEGGVAKASSGPLYIPKRVNLLVLPGAHSDIAGVYPHGVGNIYREMTEQILYRLGLIEQNCWESDEDYSFGGKHDSRGAWDVLQGRSAPNERIQEARSYFMVPVKTRSIEEIVMSVDRLNALVNANTMRGVHTSSQTRYLEIPSITVKRNGDRLDLISSASIDLTTAKYSNLDGIRRLSYQLKEPLGSAESTWILNDDFWSAIPEGKEAVLSYSLQRRQGKVFFHFFVDNVRVATYKSDSETSQFVAAPRKLCRVDANGIPQSPLDAFIITPGREVGR